MAFPCLLRKPAVCLLLGVAPSLLAFACDKKPPPDRHVVAGYRLLRTDARKALEEFNQARNPKDPTVLLGQGLAYEGIRDYSKAEATLENARKLADGPGIWLPLARVRVMLGKLDEARRGIDAVTGRIGSDLSALLLETCLANDRKRAQAALGHLNAWPAKRPKEKGAAGIPAEYHMARAALLRQLGDPEKAKQAESAASTASVTSDSAAIALATLAYRAGRRDFSVRLLEWLAGKSKDRTILRQTAVLCHALGAHALTARVLSSLPDSADKDGQLLRLRAENDFVTKQPRAVVSLRRAIAAAADTAAAAELQVMLAEALMRTDSANEARSVLDELLTKQPTRVGAQLVLARMDLVEGNEASAVARLKPLATEGGPLAAHELLAWAELQAKHYDQARTHLQEVLRRAPSDQRALTVLVGLELREGRHKAATDVIEQQIQRSPKDPALWLLLAKVVRETGGAEPAEAALRRGVEALPDQSRLWIALASEQRRRNGKAEALATLKQAESKNPSSVSIAAAMATLHTQMGKPEQALRYYEKVLRFAEGDVGALNNTAMLYADDLNAPAKAVELAERAHQLAPSYPAVTDTLGWALYRRGGKGDVARARELLESVQDKLTSPTSKYHLGLVLMASGATEDGKRLLRMALAMPENFPEAEAARQTLSGAR